MPRAFLHRAEGPADDEVSARAGPQHPAGPALAADASLEMILARCREDIAAGVAELRRWQDARLRTTLERMLGAAELTDGVLDRLLAEVARDAGAPRPTGASAEDWLFARLRLQVREARRHASVAPQLRTVPPAEPSPPGAVAPPGAEIRPPGLPHAPAADTVVTDPGPLTIYPRLRRPTAPVHAPLIAATVYPAPPPPARWRRLALGLLLWLGAGAIGFAGLTWHTGQRNVPSPPVAPAAPAASATPKPPAPPSSPPLSARDLLGEPITDREPPVVALPRERTAPAADATAAGALRIVIHYSAGNADGGALARKVADALAAGGIGFVEIRAVPLTVATASVRFFHAGDRAAAERLVTATSPVLAAAGRVPPQAPLGFTDYDPAPRAGTLEIWIPGG